MKAVHTNLVIILIALNVFGCKINKRNDPTTLANYSLNHYFKQSDLFGINYGIKTIYQQAFKMLETRDSVLVLINKSAWSHNGFLYTIFNCDSINISRFQFLILNKPDSLTKVERIIKNGEKDSFLYKIKQFNLDYSNNNTVYKCICENTFKFDSTDFANSELTRPPIVLKIFKKKSNEYEIKFFIIWEKGLIYRSPNFFRINKKIRRKHNVTYDKIEFY